MAKKYFDGCKIIKRIMKKEIQCCSTCHDWDGCELTIDFREHTSRHREIYVCCAVAIAYDKWKQEKEAK